MRKKLKKRKKRYWDFKGIDGDLLVFDWKT